MNFDFLKEELQLSEILVTQRIPDSIQQQQGSILTLDITSRGIAAGKLAEIHLPDVLVPLLKDGRLQLWKGDQRIPLALRDELDTDGKSVAVTQSSLSLVWPEDPELDANGLVQSAPHTKHRFTLRVTDGTRLPDDAYPLKLDIRNAVTGKKAQVIGDILIDERTFQNLAQSYTSREEFLQRYPFFQPEGDTGVRLSGNHIITETIVIPANVSVTLQPGTVLRMREGVSILSYAPVTMIGYKEVPVIIEAERPEAPWGVFAILNAKKPSALQWVDVSGGSEARINGVLFTGMLAFHNSPVTVVDSVIRNAHGDDGLNLKYVYVDVNRVRFENNDFDGLDVDYALSGVVENSLFINNGNDGIDVSYSPIIIRNVEVDGSGDKCISIGEQSTPLIYDTTVKNCKYGVVVKDDSHAKVERVLFEKNKIGIGAYVKKEFFQAPSVTVTESTFRRNDENTLALSGAVITIDSAE